jgi:hypothetical protein
LHDKGFHTTHTPWNCSYQENLKLAGRPFRWIGIVVYDGGCSDVCNGGLSGSHGGGGSGSDISTTVEPTFKAFWSSGFKYTKLMRILYRGT